MSDGRRMLVSAWAGMGNLGDDWLMDTMLRSSPSRLERGVLLEPTAAASAYEGIDVIRWPSMRGPRAAAEVSRFRRAVSRYDGVVFAGGGWLAGDQGARGPARWLARLSLIPGPLFGVGLGIGPFPSRLGRTLARHSLRRLRGASLRSSTDQCWARRISKTDWGVVGDLAFLNGMQRGQRVKRHGVVVCMPAPRLHWWDMSEDQYAASVIELARSMAHGEEVRFVNFQLGESGDDAFWSRYDVDIVPAGLNGALELMAGARVVVAGRLHAAIGAALNGAEVLPLAYHHKFATLEMLGITPQPMRDVVLGAAPARPQRADPRRSTTAQARLHDSTSRIFDVIAGEPS